MTENNTPEKIQEMDAQEPEAETQAEQTAENRTNVGNAEAKRYRLRLRETEAELVERTAELEQLRADLEAAQQMIREKAEELEGVQSRIGQADQYLTERDRLITERDRMVQVADDERRQRLEFVHKHQEEFIEAYAARALEDGSDIWRMGNLSDFLSNNGAEVDYRAVHRASHLAVDREGMTPSRGRRTVDQVFSAIRSNSN